MPGSIRRLPVRALLLLAGLVACLRYFLAEVARLKGGLGFPLDDSWIHLQFARNLAHGAGLVYNPGEFVTGSTAPLWTALLAVLFPLPGSVLLWTQLLGVALYLAGIDATWRLSRELGLGEGLSALAAAPTLATSWLALVGRRGGRPPPPPPPPPPPRLLGRVVGAVGDGAPSLHPALALGDDPPP